MSFCVPHNPARQRIGRYLVSYLGPGFANNLTCRNLTTEEESTLSWRVSEDMADDDYVEPFLFHDVIPSQPPGRVAFLTPNNDNMPMMMAVGYRAHPVLVWNALDLRIMGIC